MLVEFRVANHRSVRTEQTLTMEAGRVGDEGDARPRLIEGHSEPILPLAVLYGANASGKSNVLSAFAFMRDAVTDSHRLWAPESGVPRDPFAWGVQRAEPSLFEVTIIIDGTRYQYGFVASDEQFQEEWLYAWPLGKKQNWFERDFAEIKPGNQLRGDYKTIADVTRPNALFLSAAVQLKNDQLRPIFSWFSHVLFSGVKRSASVFVNRTYWPENLIYDLYDDESRWAPSDRLALQDGVRAMLRASDFGIADCAIEKRIENVEVGGGRTVERPRRRIMLKHDAYQDAWLPLEEESNGTRTLLKLAIPILWSIRRGSPLFVDELEASLHPSLAQQIVRQFNDRSTNPKNAQLIFTTHDTNLLGTLFGDPAVRRDQVWLTEKEPKLGGTVIYPLTDYKPRKDENLERGYIQGRYGAIPFLGNFTVNPEPNDDETEGSRS